MTGVQTCALPISLAVLSFDFTGFTSRFATSLPDAPLLTAEESYGRLLRRATHTDAAARFHSAADMADQSMGVLREVLSAADGLPRPATSSYFTPERRTFGADPATPLTGAAVAAALPIPLVDPADPGAAFLATLSTIDPAATISALQASKGSGSIEVGLRLVHALIEAGAVAEAYEQLKAVKTDDWRKHWYGGLIALATGDTAAAVRSFEAVYDLLPGEIAPRLALAAANELAGDAAAATRRYERVWRADRGYPSAAFGLARMRVAVRDRAGAITVLDQVPDSSSQHVSARIGALRAGVDTAIGDLSENDLLDASARLERLRLDALAHAQLSIEMFAAAIAWAEKNPRSSARLLGRAMTERDLRLGLERAYRQLATLATDTRTRYDLIDRANAIRPRTMV